MSTIFQHSDLGAQQTVRNKTLVFTPLWLESLFHFSVFIFLTCEIGYKQPHTTGVVMRIKWDNIKSTWNSVWHPEHTISAQKVLSMFLLVVAASRQLYMKHPSNQNPRWPDMNHIKSLSLMKSIFETFQYSHLLRSFTILNLSLISFRNTK